MKLKDLLEKVDKDQFIIIKTDFYDMTFETNHSAEFYLKHGDVLNYKEISFIYTKNDTLCVKLKN